MLVPTYNNQTLDLNLPSQFNNKNLLAIPALIDPHVHFRTPGAEHKENWITGIQAAIAGGVTTVLDMPNNTPSTISTEALEHKTKLIETQLSETNIPLHYGLYFGATNDNFEELHKIIRSKDQKIIGIKLFMGSSTGNLLVDNRDKQEEWFKFATELNLPIAVHAESEQIISLHTSQFPNPKIEDHSKIRPREAAMKAVGEAIAMAKKYDTKLYILHLSTKEEVELVKQAKMTGVKVYAEVTPHHLFLNESDYDRLGTLGQMNPPLRTADDQKSLWGAILDGTIDTIGTDHAPHTLEEKAKPYPDSPSGIPGIETYLALLLDAKNRGKISLEKIVELTHANPQKIFNLPDNKDWVIVDLDLKKEIKNEDLKTKCGWSPFAGTTLRGWPIATILNNKIFLTK